MSPFESEADNRTDARQMSAYDPYATWNDSFGLMLPMLPGATNEFATLSGPEVVIGCAGSIVLSALAANFWNNRQLTTAEAWTCGLLYWVPMPYQSKPVVRSKG